MTGVKRPLVALLIANEPEMRKAILEGRKRITIREGWCDYHPRTTVMLCAYEEPWCVLAEITVVRHKRLFEVTTVEWQADGYANREEMLLDLRRFYPKIGSGSPVTVIYWENVRGKLVDDWTELRKSAWVLQTGDPLD